MVLDSFESSVKIVVTACLVMIAVMLASSGILNCDFFIDPRMIIFTTIGISLLGLLTLFIVSNSIRKISTWKMLEEREN